MRWIQWRCPFGCTYPSCGHIAKNVSHLRLLNQWKTSIYPRVLVQIGIYLTEFKRLIPSSILPTQKSWTDRYFLNRWLVKILKISKIGEIAVKNLNIYMITWGNRNLCRRNSSLQSPLKFIPYKRREQTAPSWIAGQLKSSKSAKPVKFQWKTWISWNLGKARKLKIRTAFLF